jgi:XRE family transcriptional regulator, regulator of sulfur utilization
VGSDDGRPPGQPGSSALLAEAIHSVADSTNQCLLFLGGSRATRPPTELHPFGFGRSRNNAEQASMIPYRRKPSTPRNAMPATSSPPPAATSSPRPEHAVDSAALGARVRALREGSGLSLRDLSERSGVSATTLSQVERGESSPTLSVAARIAGGLDLSLSQLLRLDEGPHVVVVRAGAGRSHERRGHLVEELTPALPGQRADVSMHVLEAGAGTGGEDDPPIHEPGSRETIVLLSGAVELVIDADTYRLEQGDSVTFDADLPHRLHNSGAAEARLLAVVAAGLRRS